MIERSAYRASFSPWLFDVFLAGILMLLGWFVSYEGASVEASVLALLLYGVAVFAWVGCFKLVQARLVRPRVGYAKFGPARQSRVRRSKWALGGSVAMGVVLLVLTPWLMRLGEGASRGLILLGLFGLQAVVVFGLMGYYLDYPQGYLWGWLFALVIPSVELSRVYLGLEVPVFAMAAGLAMTAYGLVGMRRFLQDYPLPDEYGLESPEESA